MTITNSSNVNIYIGSQGITGAVEFPYTFRIFQESDLVVTLLDTLTTTTTTLAIGSDYTISGVGDENGGFITLIGRTISTSDNLALRRVRPLTQETDIRNQGEFFPEIHEDTFDHLIMVDQQNSEEIARSIRTPVEIGEFDATLPSNITTPNATLVVNSNADGFDVGPTSDQIASAQQAAIDAQASEDAALLALNQANAALASATTAQIAAEAAQMAAETSASTSFYRDVVFVNTPTFTVNDTHRGVLLSVDASLSNVTIILPNITNIDISENQFLIAVRKSDASGNRVLVRPAFGNAIDESANQDLFITNQGSGAILVADLDPQPDSWITTRFGITTSNLTVDKFAGDNSTTVFNLSTIPGSINNTQVFVSGVYFDKSRYNLAANVLTFDDAPPADQAGINNINVVIGSATNIGFPADNSVTTSKIVDKSITSIKVSKKVRFINSDGAADLTDDNLYFDASSGNINFGLPAATTCMGREYTVEKTDASPNFITIAGIFRLSNQGFGMTLISDGGGWRIKSTKGENFSLSPLTSITDSSGFSTTIIPELNTSIYTHGGRVEGRLVPSDDTSSAFVSIFALSAFGVTSYGSTLFFTRDSTTPSIFSNYILSNLRPTDGQLPSTSYPIGGFHFSDEGAVGSSGIKNYSFGFDSQSGTRFILNNVKLLVKEII